MMSERREAVFPVPDGISSTPWPWEGRERHGSTNTKLISIHYRTKFEDWWVSHATFDLCVQGSLELQHVGVLLGVHMVVGEDDR